jgi:hypothetical protein
MNQSELFEWLQKVYNQGDKRYWNIKMIRDIFPFDTSIGRKVNRLYAWGYLEIEEEARWYRKFRIKSKYKNLKIGLLKSPLDPNISAQEYRELGRK